eukprot:3321932-Rhodomonas_salina.1
MDSVPDKTRKDDERLEETKGGGGGEEGRRCRRGGGQTRRGSEGETGRLRGREGPGRELERAQERTRHIRRGG